jgi:methylated-DNA-[protein]-cysteine S-methyltransferase
MNLQSDEPDVSGMFAALSPDPDDVTALRRRLLRAAEREGLLEIGYATIDSPLGPLLLAASAAGLVRVAYESEGHDHVLDVLASRVTPRILRAPHRLDTAARELDEYFAGRRRTFDLPLDRSLSTGFRRLVLQQLPEITYGHTASYGEIARAVGSPRAFRAVGTACATNPLPIVIPCHRVLRADGTLGEYVGGPVAKSALLHLEAQA